MTFYIVVLFISLSLFVHFKYFKPGTFRLGKIVPLVIVFGIFAYLDISSKRNDQKFYDQNFKSRIIDCKNSGKEEVIADFYLDNGLFIYSQVGDYDLHIGDIIIKDSNTYVFRVYRKDNNGLYKFYKKYKYLR